MQLDAHRSMKRFRATGTETLHPEMLAIEGKSIDAPLNLGTGRNMSWRDTLVQPSHVVNEGSYTEQDLVSLDEVYGLDENLDCTITRGNKGPSFSFYERAMARMCAP